MTGGFPIAGAAAAMPAPLWLLMTLKAVGFFLHVAAMHLVYAGLPLAVAAALIGGEHGRRLASRLAAALPVALAVAINFGVVPLLFLQVIYAPVIYPATVLIAWPWFSIVPMLLVAYAGIYAFAMLPDSGKPGSFRLAAGAVAAVLVVAVGFVLATGLSLMASPVRMLAIFDRTAPSGAVTGLALNVADPTFLPRWLMMFGLGVTTTAAYVLLDATRFAAGESEAYREWARKRAFATHTLGLALFGIMGLWYIFGAMSADLRGAINSSAAGRTLAGFSAILPAAAWILAWRASRLGRGAILVVLVQLAAIAANVGARQWVQSREVMAAYDPAIVPVSLQLGPLVVFLTLFVFGGVLIAWMVRTWTGLAGNRA